MVLFDEYAASRNTGTTFGRTNLFYHKQVLSGQPKRAGTCSVLFATAHAQLRNANAVGKKHKNRAHVVVHRNTQGRTDKEYVTNEEEERRQESKEARYR
jgi:hypothetical protein